MDREKFLDISWGSIFKIFIAFVIFYIVYMVKDILIWFIFALIISILFSPAIDFFRKFRIPRSLAVIFVYVVFFGLLGLSLYLTIPMLVGEIQQFSQLFPQYFERIAPPLKGLGVEAFENIESFTAALGILLQKASSDILSALGIFFGGMGSMIFVLTVALFLSLEEGSIEKVVALLAPKKHENFVLAVWERAQTKVAGWFGSRILTCLFVGIAVFIMLHFFFGVKYSFAIALLAGVLDFIPIVGPFAAGAVAFLVVALDSWLKGLFVLVGFFLIQQIEGSILSPVLTKKFVGLPPVLVLVSLSIGGQLLGMLGAILAIPLAGILFEFIRDYLRRKKLEQAEMI